MSGELPATADSATETDDVSTRSGTRDLILQRARDLFARHGYRGTPIRQLTAGLGMTPAALYYHFSSKEEVLAQVLAPMERDGEVLIARMAEMKRSPEALCEILDRYFDLLARDIVVFRLIADDVDVQQSDAGQRLRAQARQLYAWLVGPSPDISDRIRAAAAVGTVRLSIEQAGADPRVHREAIVGRALRIMTD